MHDEVFSDGVSEITVTGPIIRIDLSSLSSTERDGNNNPKPMFRQRIVMPVDAFANSVSLMQKVLQELIDAGLVQSSKPRPNGEGAHDPVPLTAARPAGNFSPNFS